MSRPNPAPSDPEAPPAVLIALGSNLGDRRAHLAQAVQALTDAGARVLRHSSIYETAPDGGPPGQPDFLNAVLLADWPLSPPAILDACLHVEQRLGRKRTISQGPRVIDIDLLACGDRVMHHDRLTLPHPRMHRRAFVLVPLAEIAPDWRHPRRQRTAAQLLADLSAPGSVILNPPADPES